MSETPAARGPLSDEQWAEIRNIAGIDSDPHTYQQVVTLALRDVLAELKWTQDELAAWLERESADAAAGSYAGRAEKAEAALARARQQNADLIAAWKQGNARRDRLDALSGGLQRSALEDALEQRTRAEQAEERAAKAEAALAEMRERHEVQWATRIGDDSDGILARYYPDDEWTCRQRAALGYGVPHHLVQRDIYPTPWRDADATPRTALKRAADEQGVPPVCDVDKLTAPEHERLSDEEWTAYAGALGIETGDEQGNGEG